MEDMHGACIVAITDSFTGHPNGKVINAISVEVSGHEGSTEEVAGFGCA